MWEDKENGGKEDDKEDGDKEDDGKENGKEDGGKINLVEEAPLLVKFLLQRFKELRKFFPFLINSTIMKDVLKTMKADEPTIIYHWSIILSYQRQYVIKKRPARGLEFPPMSKRCPEP